jgi:uncharacterized membrane protein
MNRSVFSSPTRARRERGAVIPLVALALTTLMLGTAFSVDHGRMRTARRDLQADADFLALDAASVLDGLSADAALDLVVTEANESAVRNGYDFEAIKPHHVELGIWDRNTFTPVTGSQIPNAVRITLRDSVEMFFDFSTDAREVTRSAIGIDDFAVCLPYPCTPPPNGVQPASRAELGSFLARLDTYQTPLATPVLNQAMERQATLMNHLYTRLLGITSRVRSGGGTTGLTGQPAVTGPDAGLQLDVVSYKGLADAVVSLDRIAEELAAEGHLGAATVDALAAAPNLKITHLLEAAVAVLDQDGGSSADASSLLADIAARTDSSLEVQLGRMLQASSGRAGALETFVNVGDLLLGAVSVVNGRNFVDVELPLNVPGAPPTVLARVTVIEPPQWHRGLRHAGQPGPSTSQIRVEVNVPVPALQLDLGLLNPLLGALNTRGNIPLVVEVAKAESEYTDMACPTSASTSWTDLLVENGGVEVRFDPRSAGILATAALRSLPTTAMVDGTFNLLTTAVNLRAKTDVTHVRTWIEGSPLGGTLTTPANVTALNNYEIRRHFPPYQSEWLSYPSAAGSASTAQTFDSIQFNSSGLTAPLDSLLNSLIVDKLDEVVDQLDTALVAPLLGGLGAKLAGSDARVQQLLCKTPFVG